MKLYLHIGTEKTGSSFIQSYLANNRRMLSQHGIYFPKAGMREADMQSGRISPGNASELNTLLVHKSWTKVEQWLKDKYKAVKANECNKLLLSNEVLIKTFSETNVLEKFIKISKSVDFDLQDLLLIIREPIAQALSLYKHRSKNGDMLPIIEWLESKYSLADCLKNFYRHIKDLNVGLKQYPYKTDSQYLVEVCVKKWLGLNENIKIEHTSVNPSLTLSELKLMSEIKKQDAFLAKTFYNSMIAIPSEQKSDDIYAKTFYKTAISDHLYKQKEVWGVCNSNMTEGRIALPEPKVHENIEKQKVIEFSFSEIQLMNITQLISLNRTSNYKNQKLINSLKSIVISILPKSTINQIMKIKR